MSEITRSPQPDETWDLDRWRMAADPDITGPKLLEIAFQKSAALGLNDIDDEEVNPKQYYEWAKKGIPRSRDAIKVIAGLSHLAYKNDINLLNSALLRDHARIFLISGACRDRFAEPDENTLKKLSIQLPHSRRPVLDNDYPELARRVHPTFPAKLFGRSIDLDRVLEGMQHAPICVIDSVAGNGKTALAWYAAKRAVKSGLVRYFEWTTDKRVMINSQGKPTSTGEKPLDFNRIMRSMAVRFNWHDVATAQDNELEGLCADRLQRGLYLLVIDNLETMSQYEEVVERLHILLHPIGDRSPQMSRGLITSRVHVAHQGCSRVEIEGLDLQATEELIQYNESTLFSQRIDPLTSLQRKTLWEATAGNPLFLNIALSRYKTYPQRFDEIIDHLRAGNNFFNAFENLFGVLYENLSDEARWLASAAVKYEVITLERLLSAWNTAGGNREEFDLALGSLISSRVLDVTSAGNGEYTFHPLIRAYILSRR
jgi:hypothetical protein